MVWAEQLNKWLWSSNKITINTAEYFGKVSINVLPSFYVLISLSFQRWWDNGALFWQSHPITFRELLILIMWNVLLTQMEFVLWHFIDHWTILIMFNIILEQTRLCAIILVQRATKMSVVFVRNLIMKVKCG